MDRNIESLESEDAKLHKLKGITNFTVALLNQSDLTLGVAQKLIAQTRAKALKLFPEAAETFDLIYGFRFCRIIVERYRLQ